MSVYFLFVAKGNGRTDSNQCPCKVRFPRYPRIGRQNTVEDSSVQNEHDCRDQDGHEIPPEKSEENQKESERIYNATCADVIGWPGEKPYQDVGPEIRPEKDMSSNGAVKEEQYSSEEKHRNGIGDEMQYVTMDQRGREDTDESMKRPGNDPKNAQREA